MNKRFQALAFFLISLIILSCGEEGTPSDDVSELVGNWVMISAESTNCSDPQDDEFQALVCSDQTCIRFEFKTDGTFTTTSTDSGITENINGTYTVSGNTFTFVTTEETINGTFQISGTTLTINSTDSESGCDVEAIFEKQ